MPIGHTEQARWRGGRRMHTAALGTNGASSQRSKLMIQYPQNSVWSARMSRKQRLSGFVVLFLLLAMLPTAMPAASASIPPATPAASTPKTYYHTGAQEGSTAIALDNDYMLVGDDNDNL